MIKKIIFALFITAISIGQSFSQSKMITGQKHTLFVELPPNWLQAQNEQLPFFIKPKKKDVSNETYMYVYGIDYNENPRLNDWVKGNNDYLLHNFPGLKIDTLNPTFDNIKAEDYSTGNYLTITYAYPNGRNEVILVIECKSTIVSVALSAKDKLELKELFPSFIELSKSLKILGTTLTQE